MMFIVEVSYGCPSDKYPLNGIFQWDQTKALHDLGNKVVFVAIDLRSIRRWRKWGISQWNKEGIPVYELNIPLGPVLQDTSNKIGISGFRKILKRIIREHGKPDIVHVHFGETALCVVKACQEEGIPYVVTEHSSGVNRDDLTEREIAPLRYVYQNASAVIAVSSALANRIQHYTGIQASVIPNIIDLSLFKCNRKEHERFRFVSAGTLNYGKGFDVLLKAFSIFLRKGHDAELIIMGDGSERETLLSLVKELKLDGNVKLFGRYVRTQLSEILSDSDVFVLASRGETFGVVYAEALACGVPVIATHCGGPEDFINEYNGMLVEVDDPFALSDAMLTMYKKSALYESNLISEEVTNQFSSKVIAKKLIDVFHEIGVCKRVI